MNYAGLEATRDTSAHASSSRLRRRAAVSSCSGGGGSGRPFIKSTTLPIIAPSLGGVQTLLTRPATTSHAGLSREERLRAGISDGLIRMSVGIEETGELIDDLAAALAAL